MTPYMYEGVVFDLEQIHVSVTGDEWLWIGKYDADGLPLMQAAMKGRWSEGRPWTWPDLYQAHGPLIPQPVKHTAIVYRRALLGRLETPTADYADSLAAGFVEGLHEYDARLTARGA